MIKHSANFDSVQWIYYWIIQILRYCVRYILRQVWQYEWICSLNYTNNYTTWSSIFSMEQNWQFAAISPLSIGYHASIIYSLVHYKIWEGLEREPVLSTDALCASSHTSVINLPTAAGTRSTLTCLEISAQGNIVPLLAVYAFISLVCKCVRLALCMYGTTDILGRLSSSRKGIMLNCRSCNAVLNYSTSLWHRLWR